MKKILYLLILLSVSCNNENAWNCVKKSGTLTSKKIQTSSFKKIYVDKDIELILKQGDSYQVKVITGKNLIEKIHIEVLENQLKLTDLNGCKSIKGFSNTKVFVTAPSILEIRNSSQYTVSSEGILNYPKLLLFSEDFHEPNALNIGDFKLNVNTKELKVVTNNNSNFYISGNVDFLHLKFASGVGRFEGANLDTKIIKIYHRGNNDLIVNPKDSLLGKILGTGNVIAVTRPKYVEVEEVYKGKIILP